MRQCVYCDRKDATSPDVSFHRFPKDEAKLNIWLKHMSFDIKWRPRRNTLLCSKHFSGDCVLGHRLKKGSVPTIFENKTVISGTVVNVSYEKFKIKNEEVDIGDEECNVRIELDIKSEATNESPEIIKLKNEIKESNKIEVKKEGESGREIEIKTENISDEESVTDGFMEFTQQQKNNINNIQSSDDHLTTNDQPIENSCKYPEIPVKKEVEEVKKIGNIKPLKQIFICDFCNKQFDTKLPLRRHINGKHTKSFIYECTFCAFKTYYQRSLYCHINIQHADSRTYECCYCDYRTFDGTILNKHIDAKHPKSTAFMCSYCDYKAFRKSYLRSHINTKHTKTITFSCSHCNYKTYSRDTYKKHVKFKHNKHNLNCSYCNYNTSDKLSLKKHINCKHTKSSCFSCTQCSYTTFRKSSLSSHINSKHTKTVSYDCPHCNYKTFVKNCLSQHIRSQHIKKKTFKCSYCSYTTYHKYNFGRHVKSKHSPEDVEVESEYCQTVINNPNTAETEVKTTTATI